MFVCVDINVLILYIGEYIIVEVECGVVKKVICFN